MTKITKYIFLSIGLLSLNGIAQAMEQSEFDKALRMFEETETTRGSTGTQASPVNLTAVADAVTINAHDAFRAAQNSINVAVQLLILSNDPVALGKWSYENGPKLTKIIKNLEELKERAFKQGATTQMQPAKQWTPRPGQNVYTMQKPS